MSVSTALNWYNTHIAEPLDAPLPVTVSAATNRQILIALIVILRDMGIMLWAVTRMLIALRNKQWPDFQE